MTHFTSLYTLKVLPGSYVWYGEVEVLIEYDTSEIPDNVRLLENGDYRLLETQGVSIGGGT